MNIIERILSGMRVSGRLHIGHYHGVIKNWVTLQYKYQCFFMVADIHGLTTNYANTKDLKSYMYEMVIDWLACGVDPTQATIFVQSEVAGHSELHLLLSMITPLSWLERVPTYKEQLEKLSNREIDTYGFLGYPLLQSADILLYMAKYVPVGEDQLSHVELTREIARRFNHIYGREEGFEEKAEESLKKLGARKAGLYLELRTSYQQEGSVEALEKARFLLQDAPNLSIGERERLFAYLENKSKVILTEPQSLVTDTPKLPGLDGRKMSKSYNNTILLREDPNSIKTKIRSMQTDPARVRRTDKGDPEKCPVWHLHKVYSKEEVKSWVQVGCRSAGIGCLDCKTPLIDAIVQEQEKFIEAAKPYKEDKNLIRKILADGAEQAIDVAKSTLAKVRDAMNI